MIEFNMQELLEILKNIKGLEKEEWEKEIQKFFEKKKELEKRSDFSKSIDAAEQKAIQQLINTFRTSHALAKNVSPLIANISLGTALATAFAGAIPFAVGAGLLALVGLVIKLKADNDLSKTIAGLESKLS